MRIKEILIGLTLLTALPSAIVAQVAKTFYVKDAGNLIAMMTEKEANEITDLTLTGEINAIDIKHLRDEFKSLKTLDLSNVSIKFYTGKKGTFPNNKLHVYMPNVLPAYAFCQVINNKAKGKLSLEKIILSEKVKQIDKAAFMGCENLKVFEIRRKKAPKLSDAALDDYSTAIFVPRGSSDNYRQDEEWENFAIVEDQPITLQLTLTENEKLENKIIQAGLQPNEINFLTLKGEVGEDDFKLIRNFMPNLVGVNLYETNVTAIPAFTFSQKTFLLEVILPENLRAIGQRAFSNCSRLAGIVELPKTVESIEYGAFMGCDKIKYVLATGRNITSVGKNLFGEGEDYSKLVYKK